MTLISQARADLDLPAFIVVEKPSRLVRDFVAVLGKQMGYQGETVVRSGSTYFGKGVRTDGDSSIDHQFKLEVAGPAEYKPLNALGETYPLGGVIPSTTAFSNPEDVIARLYESIQPGIEQRAQAETKGIYDSFLARTEIEGRVPIDTYVLNILFAGRAGSGARKGARVIAHQEDTLNISVEKAIFPSDG